MEISQIRIPLYTKKKRVLKTFQEYLEITKKTFLENSVPDLLFYFSCLNNEL